MEQNDQVYIKLQKHLDSQAVGFPATKTGVEIRILKHIFTPEEAEIASLLSYKFEPLKIIYSRVEHLVESPEELEKILDRIQKKGGIEFKIKNGKKHYCNAPLVVGMYEFQLDRLTPEFIKDFNDYTSDKSFGIEFLSTELPQMRTIPVAKSIHPQHNVSTFDEVTTLLQQAEEPFVVVECICRKKKSLEGEILLRQRTAKKPALPLAAWPSTVLRSGTGREIARDEAHVDHRPESETGVGSPPALQYGKSRVHLFMLRMLLRDARRNTRVIPKPVDFWASNFQAVVDTNTCEGMRHLSAMVPGRCSQRFRKQTARRGGSAPMSWMRSLCRQLPDRSHIPYRKSPTEVRPPQTREELYAHHNGPARKGRLGKLKLTGKMSYRRRPNRAN